MSRRTLAIVIAALHTVVLCGYVLPDVMVPVKFRIAATLYGRALFHQQWALFAPDPPACTCTVERHDRSARTVGEGKGMVLRRAVSGLCRYVQASPRSPGDTLAYRPPALIPRALHHLDGTEARVPLVVRSYCPSSGSLSVYGIMEPLP